MVRTSDSGTSLFAGIGVVPHTPLPPFITFGTSLSSAAGSPLYFAATSLYAGPTSLVSTLRQEKTEILLRKGHHRAGVGLRMRLRAEAGKHAGRKREYRHAIHRFTRRKTPKRLTR
jgi:hypothetical protein